MALRYILGIDLGVSSIGTALIKISPEAKDLNDINSYEKILDAGVRICSCPEGAEKRRILRSQRKSKKHRKARKKQLIQLLQEYNLLPKERSALELGLRSAPYALRAKAMQKPLNSAYELGFCIMHTAKLRGAGFIEETDEEEKSEKNLNRYQLLEQALNKEKTTLSEYLYKHLQENGCIRQRKEFIADKVPFSVPRYLVKRDYHDLMNKQAPRFNISEEQIKKIYDCIFMDFPRAPYANAPCSLLPETGSRLPKMHRLAERLRIYQQCNNIRYKTENSTQKLTKKMRDKLAAMLMQGESLNKTLIKKTLQTYTNEKILSINVYAQDEEIKAIKPFAHIKAFADIPAFWQLSEEEQDSLMEFIADPVNPKSNPDKPVLYDEEDFLHICMEKLNLSGIEDERKLYACLNSLPKDRTMLGKEASRQILEKLIEGYEKNGIWQAPTYYEAVKACGFTRENQEQKSYDELPYYGKILRDEILPIHPWHRERTAEEEKIGRIANPVVHSILNQLRKVINEIIRLYGKPEMIKLEVARDFGMSKKKRDKLEKQRLANEKYNKIIDEELLKSGYAITDKNRKKYKLLKEQGYKDIYTQANLRISDLNAYEIDHIIPQAAGGTNSFCNLVLTTVNNVKSDTFAYDFIQENFADREEAIKKHLETLPENKAWRFTAEAKDRFILSGDEKDEDYADRRLQDSRYMAKAALRYLQCICSDILAIRGGMTSQLRHLWGFDGMEFELMGLDIPRYLTNNKTGEVYCDENGELSKNSDWEAKPRIDHRHHAIDAMVLCAVTRSLALKMYKARKQSKKIDESIISMPFRLSPKNPEHKSFRELVLETLKEIRISHKAEHDTNTQLHNETAIRILDYDEKKGLHTATYMRSLGNIDSFGKLEKIAVAENLGTSPEVQKIRKRCAEIIKAVNAQKFAAEQSLMEKNAENRLQGLKETAITEQNLVQEAIRLAHVGKKYPVGKKFTLVNIREKLQCGYEPDSNHHVDFYVHTEGKQKGKIGWECIKSIDAANPNFKPGWQQENTKLIWCVCKDDILELRFTEQQLQEYNVPKAFVSKISKNGQQEYTMLAKILKFSPGVLVFVSIYDARTGTKNALKENPENFLIWTSGGLGLKSYCELQARKVSLSPFGKINGKHKKLWNGKKI